MKLYDLICVGHMGVDLYFNGNELTFEKDRFQLVLGGKYFSEEFHSGVGGGGVNVAIGAKKCGLRVGLVAKIGNTPFKRFILTRLSQVDLSTKFLIYDKDYFNISAIITRGQGERTIIHYEKPHESLMTSKKQLSYFAHARAVYMGNLFDINDSEKLQILQYAKSHDAIIILNFGSKDCVRPLKELEPYLTLCDILIQNTHEFAQLVKTPHERIDFSTNVLKKFPLLQNKIVVVTDSKNGSYGYEGEHVYRIKAQEPKKIIDTTGAGDGYTAGFLASYLKNYSVPAAMKRGAYYAARKLAHMGAN